LDRIFNVVDRAEENLVSSYRSVKGEECFTPTSKLYDDATIRVQDLSFSYKSRHDVRVLDDVSLSIQKNQISCIVGKSGSGKSTLAALLCGLYHPDSGKIIYGQNKNHLRVYADEKLSPEKVQLLHDLFGVVEQSSTTLFSGTIGENIAYGNVSP
jgi:ABC-type multidrug transport system fused ATPase/permease subunit